MNRPQQETVRTRRLHALCFTVLAGLLAVCTGAHAEDSKKPRIALLPIVVHSAEPPDYLREGMADMLTARFIQEGIFEVVRIDDPALATTRLPDALDVGRDANVDYVLFGSFTRFGAGASLDMQAAAVKSGVDGETLREIFVHSGSIGEVIPDLVDLVGKVTRFAVEGYRGPDAPVAAGPAAKGPATRAELDALRRRVTALEQSLGTGKTTGPVGPAAP